MLTPMEQLRVALQDIEDSRRVVMCSPEWESRLKTMIDARNLGGLWTVTASRIMPDDMIVIMDPSAIEAGLRQTLQRSWRDFRLGP